MSHSHGHHHGHSHGHQHDHPNDTSDKLRAVFFLNFGFAILELFGGLFTNSMAILSDALHDLGDSLAIALSWIFQRVSKKKRDKYFSYGYRRFSLISASVTSLILLSGSIFIIIEAVPRFWNPEPVKTLGMLLFAILGILINGAAAWKLWGGNSLNERAVKLHLLEDVLGWVAVLIGSIVIHFTEWYFIDPLLSVGIACFILIGVYRTLNETLTIFLQAVPADVSIPEVRARLMAIEHVVDVHDIHVWTMDGQYNVLSSHLVIDQRCPMPEISKIKREARKIVKEFGVHHQTFEVEVKDDLCEFEDC